MEVQQARFNSLGPFGGEPQVCDCATHFKVSEFFLVHFTSQNYVNLHGRFTFYLFTFFQIYGIHNGNKLSPRTVIIYRVVFVFLNSV